MEKARDFHHPYQPYDIQESFMNIVYETLQDGKVGIMESPTGTVSAHHKFRRQRYSYRRSGQVFESDMWFIDMASRSSTTRIREWS